MATLRQSVVLMDGLGGMLDVDVVIDPSTAFGVFPTSLLTRLGVQPFRDAEHRTGKRLGLVEAMLKANAAYIICGFGEEDCVPTLGFHNLASLELQQNERRDDLEPLEVEYHEHPRLMTDV